MVFLYTPPVMKTKALDVNKKKRNSPFPSKVYMQINPHSYGAFYLFLLSIYNKIGDDGAGRLAEVLVRCPVLARLVLGYNQVGNAGTESFAGVLSQCTGLTHSTVTFHF